MALVADAELSIKVQLINVQNMQQESLIDIQGNNTNAKLSDVFLFLDDIREPKDAFEYTKEEMFLKQKWVVVRNFDEFKNHIETNGMPSFISFDHDLADTHYTPEHLWTDYNKSKEWQEAQVHKEKTGYECAMWLVNFCIDNNLKLPKYYCHSMNPVGKDKIIDLLQSFQNSAQRFRAWRSCQTENPNRIINI